MPSVAACTADTYRHRDGESRPALAELVGHLRRESDAEELVLRGWSVAEVGDQLLASAGAAVPPAVDLVAQERCRHDVDSDPEELAQFLSEPGHAEQPVTGSRIQVDQKIQIAVLASVTTGH